jgi:hypothetical protein
MTYRRRIHGKGEESCNRLQIWIAGRVPESILSLYSASFQGAGAYWICAG